MRPNVLLWLLAGAVLMASFTQEMASVSSSIAFGLEQLRRSGSMVSNAVVFLTSTLGRIALLVAALLLLRQAANGVQAAPTMKSFTISGVRWGWRAWQSWRARAHGDPNRR